MGVVTTKYGTNNSEHMSSPILDVLDKRRWCTKQVVLWLSWVIKNVDQSFKL
jgi:hypothetical protein